MDRIQSLTPSKMPEFLLHVAPVCPVFIWGAPGVGKTALVGQFAEWMQMPFEHLNATQLAPEDLIGVPIPRDNGKVRFCPPENIARDEPYVLLLDELNGAPIEVARAAYSLINERRLGSYLLPEGSVIVAAGNRQQDQSQVKPIAAALTNRMLHVELRVSHRDWLAWAGENDVHPWVVEYIGVRSDHLFRDPPKTQEPFSTPRTWHRLSDAMKSYGDELQLSTLTTLACGLLTPAHATQFTTWVRNLGSRFQLAAILKGDIDWPRDPDQRDVLYFLAESFRARLLKELPAEAKQARSGEAGKLRHRAIELLEQLASISPEIAQMTVGANGDGRELPDWFMVEVFKALPRLAKQRDAKSA
jgi:MoxR-like ATPase